MGVSEFFFVSGRFLWVSGGETRMRQRTADYLRAAQGVRELRRSTSSSFTDGMQRKAFILFTNVLEPCLVSAS